MLSQACSSVGRACSRGKVAGSSPAMTWDSYFHGRATMTDERLLEIRKEFAIGFQGTDEVLAAVEDLLKEVDLQKEHISSLCSDEGLVMLGFLENLRKI